MRDIVAWIEKSRGAITLPANKKRPLRDQLGIREKILSDAQIQKTKLNMAIEKLQVTQKNSTQKIFRANKKTLVQV